MLLNGLELEDLKRQCIADLVRDMACASLQARVVGRGRPADWDRRCQSLPPVHVCAAWCLAGPCPPACSDFHSHCRSSLHGYQLPQATREDLLTAIGEGTEMVRYDERYAHLRALITTDESLGEIVLLHNGGSQRVVLGE